MTKKNFTPKWDFYMAQTWEKWVPPIRPSRNVVSVFENALDQFLSKNGKATVLILGSTPEFRDLANSRNIVPTVIDYSKENYKALGLHKKHHGKEHFILQDWLDMDTDKTFDIIMADASLNCVSSESFNRLINNISECLNLGSLFLSRTWVRLNRPRFSVAEIIREYREKYYLNYSFYPTTLGPLQEFYYDEEKKYLDLNNMAKELRALYKKGMLSSKEWEPIMELDYDQLKLKLFVPFIEDFRNEMESLFSIIKEEVVKEPYGEYCPVFIFRKK